MSAPEDDVLVVCTECPTEFTVSTRWLRMARQQHIRIRCKPCRFAARLEKQPKRRRFGDREREFWVTRLPLIELMDLAQSCWGLGDPVPAERLRPWIEAEARVRGRITVDSELLVA
jgi:hypothetical protein